MDNICKICNTEVLERSHFYKIHKIKEKDYYEKYIPKIDLLTGEKLEFKNPEQYKLINFKDKKNLKRFLENNKETGFNYLIENFKNRFEIKKHPCAPTEFELKSLQLPTIKFIEKFYGEGSYNKLTELAKLSCFRDYGQSTVYQFDKELRFIIDTREQNVLDFPNSQIQKLNYGDYSVEDNRYNTFIERKSLVDFIGTMSKGYERFKNELNRCVKDKGQLVVLIEEKYSNLLSFNYLPHCRRIKATPDFVMHRVRELFQLYPFTLQMLAVDGRKEAVRVIEKIFKLGAVIDWDLQFYYDKGLL
jgi:hypothetical protein